MATHSPSNASVQLSRHGLLPTGEEVRLFTLTNARGQVVSISEYGVALVDILVPDRQGTLADVNLGYPSLEGYLRPSNPFFGCVAGRCANRIAHGRFTLDGRAYQLATNNGENHLHGGTRGFDKRLWRGAVVSTAPAAVRFTLLSPDGEEGYPGNLTVHLTVTWTDAAELRLDYLAATDAPTLVNLTNHSYFNLSGRHGTTVYEHTLRLAASHYTPVSAALIPTGELRPVAGTPMDFTTPQTIGSRLAAVGGEPVGYDHNYALAGADGVRLLLVAEVTEPTSGRRLKVWTTEPGVQFYTGNFLDGTETGKGGARYGQHTGFCLETQHYPDSINQPQFPSVVLRPGQLYQSTTLYAFDVAP